MLSCSLFNCENRYVYPPFKNGLYLEEYFKQYVIENNPPMTRKYIPVTWTNFQIERGFSYRRTRIKMQNTLNEWVKNNPSETGYFTVVQHDDGPMLRLPQNTIVYGACSGNVPIPLVYQDTNNTLTSFPQKTFLEKRTLCSFVGNITSNSVKPNVREIMFEKFIKNDKFSMINSGGWVVNVNSSLQEVFINTTIDSKFALAPRGYGRSSFRFFEIFQLGAIPVYIWNDVNWLPFQDTIDYSRLCVSIHISKIDELEQILSHIDESQYNNMLEYYSEIKHLFTVEGMTEQIIQINS
jgi:hypothetical protein